jgi:acyl carrier protein
MEPMTRDDVVRMTNEVFAVSFEVPAENLIPEKHIFIDLGLDSLDTVDLVVALQKKFRVQLREDERIRTIRTLGDVHDFIWSIVADTQPGAGPAA